MRPGRATRCAKTWCGSSPCAKKRFAPRSKQAKEFSRKEAAYRVSLGGVGETGRAPSLQENLSAVPEDSSFFSSSSAWANVRSEGIRLKPVKISVELMERFLNSRILPVKLTLILEISQRLSPSSCC